MSHVQKLAPAVVFPVKEYPYEFTSEFVSLKRTPKVKELLDTVRKYGGNNGLTIKATTTKGTIAPREFQRPESWKPKEKNNDIHCRLGRDNFVCSIRIP